MRTLRTLLILAVLSVCGLCQFPQTNFGTGHELGLVLAPSFYNRLNLRLTVTPTTDPADNDGSVGGLPGLIYTGAGPLPPNTYDFWIVSLDTVPQGVFNTSSFQWLEPFPMWVDPWGAMGLINPPWLMPGLDHGRRFALPLNAFGLIWYFGVDLNFAVIRVFEGAVVAWTPGLAISI